MEQDFNWSQFVNLGQLVWPGLILLAIGAILFSRKHVVLAAIGLAVMLTGLYFSLLAIHIFTTNLALIVTLLVMIGLGWKLAKTKGLSTGLGVVVVVLGMLALLPTLSTYIPNFEGGQWIQDGINSMTSFLGTVLHAADQGISDLRDLNK